MNKSFFRESWPPSEWRSVVLTLFAVLFALVLVLFSTWNPMANAIRWDVLSQLTTVGVDLDFLPLGNWHYSVTVPSTVVTEWFVASGMTLDLKAIHLILLVGLIGWTLVLAALTALPRFWYFAALMAFILLLTFSRTEMLGVLPAIDKAFLCILIVSYAGAGYYLHAFRPDIAIVPRIVIFQVITLIVYAGVAWGGTASYKPLTFLAYSFPLWLTGSMLFLLLCATEIFYGLVWLSTSRITNRQGTNALPRFLVISLLYLCVLLFAFIANTRLAGWGMVILHPLPLGIAAALIGLYGFRLRCESTAGVIDFRGSGFWLYTGLLLVAAAFLSFAAMTANDPLLEVLEDMVVNSQLGMGIVFTGYVLINFLPLFKSGLEVHKVLYKPLHFSLTKARVIGFGVVAGLFSMQSLFPFHQAVAAYFNGLGDVHMLAREYTLAEQYYKMSLQQEFQNHKSNYALASLALLQGDENAAAFYFKQATLKKPSPQAYIGLSDILMKENLYFEAVFNLQEGLQKFPDNGHLQNNLGLLFSKTSVADSAYFFLKRAESTLRNNPIPAANLLAVLAASLDASSLDSLSAAGFTPRNDLAWQANWLALQNKKAAFIPEVVRPDATPADSMLSAAGYSYWINFAFNQARQGGKITHPLRRLADLNAMAGDELFLAALYTEYYSGNKTRALEALQALAENSEKNALLYRKILGHWFLQLGLYPNAIDQLSRTNDTEGFLGLAIAHSLSGNVEVGAIVLEKLRESEVADDQIATLQEQLGRLTKPVTASDSLLKIALKAPTAEAFGKAVRSNPFDPAIVTAAADYYRTQQKELTKAFQLVVDALRFNEQSPELWESYALLSLDLGLTDQAEEASEKVRTYGSATDYTTFLTRYQPKKALIEKEREEFQ